MGTTARVDTATGLLAILDGLKASGDLEETFSARPGSFARPTPFGYVDLGDEQVSHDAGTRTRVFPASLVIADRLTENAESTERMNALVDKVLDAITAHAHVSVPGGVVHSGRVAVTVGADQAPDGAWFIAARFDYGDITVQEGRD